MSISAAYMRPRSRSESFKVNMIASIDYAKEHLDGQQSKEFYRNTTTLAFHLTCLILASSA
ncbi:hypothetical protein PRUPE_8G138500 [Prunus persica]|uniref:Uncharacterized protein n=1 Tax=Prunus persica TaxID=3760 RepID=A0A251MXM6_PRUPE|nr:hypothetical protein PRUPE_8G138500 [Prunus persica]